MIGASFSALNSQLPTYNRLGWRLLSLSVYLPCSSFTKPTIMMARDKTKRSGFGLMAGLFAYALVGKLGLWLLQLSWADYAAHSSDKSYTLSMLLARLLVGLLAAVGASGVATKLANDAGECAWLVGGLVLIGGGYIHLLTGVWRAYPV